MKLLALLLLFAIVAKGRSYSSIEDVPYQVSIEAQGQHICSGALIKANIVLTAAHCTTDKAAAYAVRAGTDIKEKGGELIAVAKIRTHPKFNPESSHYDYDISVLKLEKSFMLSQTKRFIELQSVGVTIPDGVQGTVTGWGKLPHTNAITTLLHSILVPKVEMELCKASDKLLYPITERMTCYAYSYGERNSCQMESGSPLVIDHRLVGISSWGKGCALPDNPGIYTLISNEEIRNHIDSCIDE